MSFGCLRNKNLGQPEILDLSIVDHCHFYSSSWLNAGLDVTTRIRVASVDQASAFRSMTVPLHLSLSQL